MNSIAQEILSIANNANVDHPSFSLAGYMVIFKKGPKETNKRDFSILHTILYGKF